MEILLRWQKLPIRTEAESQDPVREGGGILRASDSASENPFKIGAPDLCALVGRTGDECVRIKTRKSSHFPALHWIDVQRLSVLGCGAVNSTILAAKIELLLSGAKESV